jgi:uncharacterized protein (DUF58 family)
MFNFKKPNSISYPPEVVTTLQDLMRYEFLVQSGSLLPNRSIYSILGGRHVSKLRGRGLDFEEVRHYVPGDDIRNIDWRVTARTGETHSKVFNEEKERPTFIVVDQSSTMFFGSQRFVKSVSAAQVAAISTFYTLKRGDRAGGIVFNEEGFDLIVPKRSKALVQHFLQCVVNRNKVLPLRKTAVPNINLLNQMLQRTQAAVTHDYVIVIISDFSAINAETKMYLRGMSRHNEVILVHIYDALDESLPNDNLILSDGKYQIAWQNNKRQWGEKYRENFKTIRHQLTEEFNRYRIPIVFFNTTETIDNQMFNAMSKILRT